MTFDKEQALSEGLRAGLWAQTWADQTVCNGPCRIRFKKKKRKQFEAERSEREMKEKKELEAVTLADAHRTKMKDCEFCVDKKHVPGEKHLPPRKAVMKLAQKHFPAAEDFRVICRCVTCHLYLLL